MIINLTPDWDANYIKFFDDYTHKSPFTIISLTNIAKYAGFNNVHAFTFMQLPISWKYPFLRPLLALIGVFVPVKSTHNFFRWTRELMLMSYGTKL